MENKKVLNKSGSKGHRVKFYNLNLQCISEQASLVLQKRNIKHHYNNIEKLDFGYTIGWQKPQFGDMKPHNATVSLLR